MTAISASMHLSNPRKQLRGVDTAVPSRLPLNQGHAVGKIYERTILGTSSRSVHASTAVGAKHGYSNLNAARTAATEFTRGPDLPAAVIYDHAGRYFARTLSTDAGPLFLRVQGSTRRDAGYSFRFLHPAAQSIIDGSVELLRADDPAQRHPSASRMNRSLT